MLFSEQTLYEQSSFLSYPISLALLGGRSTVGQKIISLIHSHPVLSQKFIIKEITSSLISSRGDREKKTNDFYGTSCTWREPICAMPENIAQIPLISHEDITCSYVLSCLDSEKAKIIEPFLVKKGHYVFSNASTFRMEPNIPLCIPEINGHLIENMRTSLGSSEGCLITNPNCVAVPVALALYPLRHLSTVLKHVAVTSLQSLSGAGYPGVPSFDLLSNTIPFIPQEREKILEESQKILRSSSGGSFFQDMTMSSQVHRVPVLYGHSVSLHLVFQDSVSLGDIQECYRKDNENLRAAPWCSSPLFSWSDGLGPQSRYLSHDFMGIQLGQFMGGTKDSVMSFTVLAHNLVRGAAGAVLNNLWRFIHCPSS